MTTLTARFVDRDAMSQALVALAGGDVHAEHVDVVPAPADNTRVAPSAFGAAVGSSLGAVAAGTAGVIAIVASGGALLGVGAALAAVSGGAAGGMAGGVVGAMVGGAADEAKVVEANAEHATMTIRLDVPDGEVAHAREVLTDAGGVVLETNPGVGA